MKKSRHGNPCEEASECENKCVRTEKPDVEDKIYNFLCVAEKVAIKIAMINQILKRADRKNKKRAKKLGKIDKATGNLVLKKQEKQKLAKLQKRYSKKKK